MFSALEKNESVVDLNLSTEVDSKYPNKISLQGIQLIASKLRDQKFLSIMNLKGVQIGSDGFIALCSILPFNKTLIGMNVEKNQITPRGVEYLNSLIEE